MNDEKYLIYVHEFGVSYNKRYEYQFIYNNILLTMKTDYNDI